MKVADVIRKYDLAKHPEGGYFKETLRLPTQICQLGHDGQMTGEVFSAGTSIYYLLEHESKGEFSAWHKLSGLDETWNYHFGATMTIYWIEPSGQLIMKKLGMDDDAFLQVHVPRDRWFSAVVDGENSEAFTLVGCTVFPGFNFDRFELANRESLSTSFPQHSDIISRFTRPNSCVPLRFVDGSSIPSSRADGSIPANKNIQQPY
ncbi:MAG: cupin domain-containing protein [Gammaproteobacteria bacterium]